MSTPGALMHRPTYAGATANMQVDPAASPSCGDAVESISAACAGRVELEWVPDVEASLVPDEQLRLCRSCGLRAVCLAAAIASSSEGYWAGSTTADREALQATGQVDVAAVERRRRDLEVQEERAAAEQLANALHSPGVGDLTWYRRRGCRCRECRAANAANRARQRARARGGERRGRAA